MRIRQVVLAVMALAHFVLAAGCGRPEAGAQVLSGEVKVSMQSLKFEPATITVKKGTKITFINLDAMEHDVIQVADKEYGRQEPGWKSEVIPAGRTWSITLDKPGVYPILCAQYGHYTTGMIGKITVVE